MLKKNNSNETLGELIKSARKEKGLSARKLANLLNLSHTEINNIESGFLFSIINRIRCIDNNFTIILSF